MRFLPASLLLLTLALPATPQRPTRPAWVKQGLVMASNMEALSFVRRRGGQAADYAEYWEREQTEEAILALKAQGVNAVLISLMKGAGFQAEGDDIAAAARYVQLAHKHGIKVGGYVGASIFFETMFAEEPDSPNWLQRDELGRPLHYNPGQTFRYMANRNHPGYHDFVKRVLKRGIGELGMDFVHFDQMMWWRLPSATYTEADQKSFAAFVRERYPPERSKARFGYSEMGFLRVPEFGVVAPPIGFTEVVNPLMQELMHYRSQTLAGRFKEYDEYIHQLNPQAALQANPPLDPSANNAVMYGVDVPRLLAHGDTITSEERNEPGFTADGRLISRIRTYRAGRTMGKSILFWQQPATIVGRPAHHVLHSDQRLRLAEAMAFCGNCLGLTAGLDVGNLRFAPAVQNYVDFYWKRQELFANTEQAAEVAVLRSFASTELNGSGVLPAVVLFEQSLLQAGIPYSTIYDRHLDNLGKYKVLVLANQDALSDEQTRAIERFVREGGAVVATDATSQFTDWRLRRPKLGLAGVLGVDNPPEPDAPNRPVRTTAGKGRAAYIPRLEPAVAPPPAQLYYVFRNEFWKLPKNHTDLIQSVTWALNGPDFSAAVPEWVAVESSRRADGAFFAHLVNYRLSPPVLNSSLKLRIPPGKRLREVVAESPDTPSPERLTFSVNDDVASVTLPKLGIYSVVMFRIEPK